jgi:hypothetical protein
MNVRVKVIKVDEKYRLYIYPKRVVLKEKVNGRYITRFSGVSVEHLLTSSVIDDKVKEKINLIISSLS